MQIIDLVFIFVIIPLALVCVAAMIEIVSLKKEIMVLDKALSKEIKVILKRVNDLHAVSEKPIVYVGCKNGRCHERT